MSGRDDVDHLPHEHPVSEHLPLEDYAFIGDRHTAALVGRTGSIDWLCLPRFDSPSCFTALLGTPDHGRWLLGPAESATTTRRYLEDTLVLETTHRTQSGEVRVTDLMPIANRRADVVRRVEGVRGTVRMRHEWTVRFGYGAIVPWVHRVPDDAACGCGQALVAVAGPDRLVLRGPRLPRASDHTHTDDFEVRAGDRLDFELTWTPSHRDLPDALDPDEAQARTEAEARAWLADGEDHEGPWRDAVRRSALVLRALTHEDTAGIVAAPTTSLPEDLGGERNWDYRFTWLRDAALTVEALVQVGHAHKAVRWRDWLLRAIAGDPADLQIMYTVDGGRELPERELEHLPGYAGSRPVRVGNGAVGQRQLDVLGEVMVALSMLRDHGVQESADSWALQCVLVDDLVDHWREPDNGLWEIRGPQQHFTHSRAMVWAAFDRAIRAVEVHGCGGPVERWREARDAVAADIEAHGVSRVHGGFTQHYGTDEVDAALMVLPTLGFVEATDPRFVATVEQVEQHLMRDGLVLRYRTDTGVDGLPGDESPFLICNFWLVTAYAQMGRREDAEALMDRLVGVANDVGLLAEEYDPVSDRLLGNFPQAFSHLGLILAAEALRR